MARLGLLASAAIGAAMLLPLGAASEAAPATGWSGFYAGAHLGYLFGDVTIDEGITKGGSISGPIGGAIFGYNFPTSPLSNVLFGLEADAGLAGVHGHGVNGDGCADYLYDLNWDAHFRARAGFPMGNTMPFLAAGLAVANLDISSPCDDFGGVFTGGTVGGGVDFKIAPRTIARGEVLYDFYGTRQYEEFSASFNAWTARAAILWQLP
jgi:outer membrane immunogenic protein